jgi:hypothetical protein
MRGIHRRECEDQCLTGRDAVLIIIIIIITGLSLPQDF